MFLYTVHDSASKSYLPPFTSPSERDAKLSFETAANDPQTNICKYPADFTLIQIGEFDVRSGKLTATEHVMLGNATKYKNQ